MRISVIFLAVALVLSGCGTGGNSSIIRNDAEAQAAMAEAGNLIVEPVTAYEQGFPMEPEDREKLLKGQNLLKRVIKYAPSRAEPYLILGKVQRALGQDENGLQSYAQGLANVREPISEEHKPTIAECYNDYAIYYSQEGMYTEAYEKIKKARELLPDNKVHALNEARILVQLQRLDEAEVILTKLVKEDKSNKSAASLLTFIEKFRKDKVTKPAAQP